MSCLERGQLPSPELHTQLTRVPSLELIYENVKYVFRISKSGPNRFDLITVQPSNASPTSASASASSAVVSASASSSSSKPLTAVAAAAGSGVVTVDVHALADEGILAFLDGKKHVVYGQEFSTGLRLTVDGRTCLFREEYDPTQVTLQQPITHSSHQHYSSFYCCSLLSLCCAVLHRCMFDGWVVLTDGWMGVCM